MFVTIVRAFFFSLITRRNNASKGPADALWLLSMFRLPESFRRAHRWFVPVYYTSIAAALIGPVALAAWHLTQ